MLMRRTALLLPVFFAACAEHQQRDFSPLHYNYLLPLRLNVAEIRVEQRFVPSGVPPDVSQLDPMPPVLALRNMAADRLQALGASGYAVFAILNASLTRQGDTITGNFEVQLDIYSSPNVRAGYAESSVTGSYSGNMDDLAPRLYDMTRSLMDRMNVEFEYQVRRSLGGFLLPAGATQAPVEQQSLPGSPQVTAPPPAPDPQQP
jgi:hypothetical protein